MMSDNASTSCQHRVRAAGEYTVTKSAVKDFQSADEVLTDFKNCPKSQNPDRLQRLQNCGYFEKFESVPTERK